MILRIAREKVGHRQGPTPKRPTSLEVGRLLLRDYIAPNGALGLLSFEDQQIVDRLAFGVRSLDGDRETLAVLGDYAPLRLHHLARLLVGALRGQGVDTTQRDCVGDRRSLDRIVLAVVIRRELHRRGFAVGTDPLAGPL